MAADRNTISIGFSVRKDEQARLDHLVDIFGNGNRSAFLRTAMSRMEVVDRAQRLQRLQAYGSERSTELGIAPGEVSERVKRILAAHAPA